MQMRRSIAAMLFLILGLSGCISGIQYGDVPHSDLAAGPRCNPPVQDRANISEMPFFAVTSRLPNCRGEYVNLSDFRSEKTRYLRFGEAAGKKSGIRKKDRHVPMAFQTDSNWWAGLQSAANANDGQILIYVHGYRESFASSSSDAAQISRLTEFSGPVIHYSWPSEHEFFSYAVDVGNMEWNQKAFRGFLSALSQKHWAKDIIIISHSLGARLVIPSIAYADRKLQHGRASAISKIMLISPDADRRQFERDIGNAVLPAKAVSAGRKLIIFVSAKDKALKLSRTIHGYPRLGNPYCFDPFKAKKIEGKGYKPRCYADFSGADFLSKNAFHIIDTSEVSGGRSGHSDYLRSAAACAAFAAIVQGKSDGARLPTHLPYAAALPPYAKGEKPDHKVICKRD